MVANRRDQPFVKNWVRMKAKPQGLSNIPAVEIEGYTEECVVFQWRLYDIPKFLDRQII